MGRTTKDSPHERCPGYRRRTAPDAGAGAAATPGGGLDDAARRRAPPAQDGAQRGLLRRAAGGLVDTAAARRAGGHSQRAGGVPAGQLAGAVWHRAGARPALGADAGPDQPAGARRLGVRLRALAPGRRALSSAVPIAADGAVRCLPHRRPVQSVRVFRGHAGGLVRPAAARLGPRARARRHALHRHQPGGLGTVSDWRVHALWPHRHAEHGRPGAAHSDPARRRPRPAARSGGHSGHGLPHQGRRLAAQLLAGAGLQRGHGAGGRAVCHHDQAGHLRHPAAVDAAVWRRGRGVGAVWQPVAIGRWPADHGLWRRRHDGLATPGPSGGVCGAGVLGHGAGRQQLWAKPADRRHAVLPSRLDTGRWRSVPAGRRARPLAQPQSGRRPLRAGGRRGALSQRPPGTHAWLQPRRKRRRAGGAPHPGCHGVRRPGFHGLHADARGHAAAARFSREIRHAERALEPARARRVGRAAARAHRLDFSRRADRQRLPGADRTRARRHRPFLGVTGTPPTARGACRRPADWRPAAGLRAAGGGRRPGAAFHAGRSRRALRTARLRAGGSWRRARAKQRCGLDTFRAWGENALKRLLPTLLPALLPAPLLSLALWGLWMVLGRSVDAGQALMGLVLGIAIPLLTRGLRPLPVRVRHPVAIARLALRVAADTIASNLDALRVFLAPGLRRHPAGFAHVPLELRDPNALAVLAVIVCLTPGTAWAELSSDHSMLLLHVLELGDEAQFVALVKERYERPLMEIFE
ncbi:Na+/H+ antiporter subunit E [Simplicispira hankyongi]|uniref:Na+/H+ antiporter subunit E n=1 Tax=Simplicispira hankyongi TaxID=2315688 RepID=A0A398CJT7_9BURK|nr:Na+/H+ antiporter subunit E [Simplicispira hankyongi]